MKIRRTLTPYSGRDTTNRGAVGNILDNYRPGGDQASLSHRNPLSYYGPRPHMGESAQGNISGKGGAGSHVNVIVNPAIVVNRCGSVNDNISANPAAGLDYGARHQLRPFAEKHVGADDRRAMDHRMEPVPPFAEVFENLPAHIGLPYRTEAIDQQYFVRGQDENRIVPAQDGDSEEGFAVRFGIGIRNAFYLSAACQQCINYYLGMTTGAENQEGFRHGRMISSIW